MDAVQTARRGSVFERIGGVRHRLQYPAKTMVFHRIPVQRSNEICKFWVQGRCNRNPCRFLHSDPQKTSRESMKQDSREVICNKEEQSSDEAVFKKEEAIPSKKAQICDSILRKEDDSDGTHKRKCPPEFDDDITQPIPKRKRPNLEATLLKVLEGKKEAVTGLALPCGCDKLYTGTKDGTLSIWDCNSGACVHSVKLGTEITCMMTQGSWFFVATDSGIKACDTSSCTEQPLATDGGNVCSLATDGAASLFGGLRDGSIMVWKGGTPQALASLKGHQLPVLSLSCKHGRLYAASEDQTIRVWDINTFECFHVLKAHSGAVTSVLCWETYVLSGSLDKTLKLKVWDPNEDGTLKHVHQLGLESSVVALSGNEANTSLD